MLKIGDEIGRYRIGAILGTGRLTQVYNATHLQLGSRHAIKFFLDPHPELQRLMLLEGRAQSRLKHPHIVSVSDVLRLPDGCVGLVMEFINGATLERWLRVHGAMPLEEASILFSQILAAVGTAHLSGVHHGDLRPGAVLLSHDGLNVKVADFGIGQLPHQLSGLALPEPSPAYLAPEQVREPGGATVSGDIFSLGCILFEMLTGQPAFDDSSWGSLHAPRELRTLLPGCPPHIAAALDKALARDPEQRFASCQAMAEVLFPDRPHIERIRTGIPRGTLIPDGDFLQDAPMTVIPAGEGLAPSSWSGQTTATPASHPGTLPDPRPRSLGRSAGLLGLLLLTGLGGWWMGASREIAPLDVPAEAPIAEPAGALRIRNLSVPAPRPPPAAIEVAAPPVEAVTEEPPRRTVRTPREEPVAAERPVESPRSEAVPVEVKLPAEVVPAAVAPLDASEHAPGDAVAALSAEPDPHEPPVPDLTGAWSGRYQGLPFTLSITRQDGERISGTFQVQIGTTQRRFSVSGLLSGSRFTLSDGRQVRIGGSVSGGVMSGGSIRIGRNEQSGWSATR